MCEIFPEVPKCCIFVPARIALIYIGVLSIMTGVLAKCMLTQGPSFTFTRVLKVFTRLGSLNPESIQEDPNLILSEMNILMRVGLSGMALLFMVLGILLLVSNLLDAEQMVLLFVWGTVLNVLTGFLLAIGVTAECLMEEVCLLSDMDWFTGSFIMVSLISYLFLWCYFAAVANTYSSGYA